jgi:hypothetical protein
MKTVKQMLSDVKASCMCLSKNKRRRTDSRNKPEIDRKVRFVNGISLHYAKHLNMTQQEVLHIFEENRSYWAMNYYQPANFPRISEKNVIVLDDSADFLKQFPSKQYICPACEGISSKPMECTSGIIRNNKECDWKSYGLFGCLGKGVTIIYRSNPRPVTIFRPKELDGKDNWDIDNS